MTTYDENSYATEYKYDNLGRVIEQKTPFEEKDGTIYYSTKQMWYDNNGNIVKERVYTNAAGETSKYNEVKYTYDILNRLVMTESNDGTNSNYVQNYYDAKGNLLRVYTGLHAPLTINGLDDVTTGSDTEYAVAKYSYDSLGRLLTTTDALGNVESNTYDTANGLLLSSTDRNGNTFNFTYDGSGKVKSKALADGTNAETTVYGLTGQPLSKQNGTATISYVYNDKGLIASETNSASGVVKAFTYDSAGNVLTMTVTRNGVVDMSQNYVYDKLNASVDYFKNLVSNTTIESGYKMEAGRYDKPTLEYYQINKSYDLWNANCLQMSMKGFNKGKLKDGTSVSSFMSGQLEKTTLATIRPNTAEGVFNQLFFNRRFTRSAAKNDLTWEALYGSPSDKYKAKGLYYARTLGVSK